MANPKYDFIVVGAGAAGGLLSNKLSEHFKVLLIEAGPNINDDPRVQTPAQMRSLHGTDLDWQYVSEPEPELNGRRLEFPAGKLVGGSTAINSHVLAHSCESLHDEWVELGNPSWSWEAMKPYFEFMNLQNTAELNAGNYRGSGNLKASFNKETHPLQKAWSESYQKSTDGSPGTLMVANAIDSRGHRSHSGTAYVEPALERLTVIQGQVEKVLFNDNQAIGVQLLSGQTIHGKEIILCAGTFGSAKILELSGIGKGDVVPAWLNLPVGENLQDHLKFPFVIEVEGVTTRDDPNTRDQSEGAVYDYAYHSLKPESLEGLNIDDSFVHKMVFDPKESSANLVMSRSGARPGLEGKFMTIIVMYSYPLSRGTAKIMSADPSKRPKINFNHFNNPVDVEVFAKHVLDAQDLLDGPLKQYIKPGGQRWPSFESNLVSIKEALREHTSSNYHACGTCSMMDRSKGGVVDQSLRVYGTKGLRVCDASVIPVIPRANILSTVYAMAWKAADSISAEYKQRSN